MTFTQKEKASAPYNVMPFTCERPALAREITAEHSDSVSACHCLVREASPTYQPSTSVISCKARRLNITSALKRPKTHLRLPAATSA